MSSNKQLGTGLENRVVRKARDEGLEAAKQPGSGVFKDFPHDAVIENTLVECKVRTAQLDTEGKRYVRLDLDWLRRVIDAADQGDYQTGVVVINAKGSRTPSVLMDFDYFLKLLKIQKSEIELSKYV